VDVAGGADALLAKAQEAFELGEYRWVAELVNHLVFADPEDQRGRQLQAAALEQLGYQSESGTWRNAYLMGALELRHGVHPFPTSTTASPDSVRAMDLDLFFDYLGVRLNGQASGHERITLNFVFTDTGERAFVEVVHGTLSHSLGRTDPTADATVTLTRPALNRFILGETTLSEEAAAGEIHVTPDHTALDLLGSYLDTFSLWFHITEP
jgi:alkyl sulfatase BDS1-like metallo-beta-lactamase superfamily hydrolase